MLDAGFEVVMDYLFAVSGGEVLSVTNRAGRKHEQNEVFAAFGCDYP